jgi:hypothetical protein
MCYYLVMTAQNEYANRFESKFLKKTSSLTMTFLYYF